MVLPVAGVEDLPPRGKCVYCTGDQGFEPTKFHNFVNLNAINMMI